MVKLFSKPKKKSHTIRHGMMRFEERTSRVAARPEQQEYTGHKIDRRLAFITFVFVCFGLIFTYSSSAFDSSLYFKRQLLFDVLGLGIALFLSQTYSRLQEIIKPIWLMYVAWGLLVWVLFTPKIANVHRWIHLGFFNLQPSEVAKVALVIYLADYLSRWQGKLGRNWLLLLPPLVVSGITFGLMGLAPDLGTPMLMGAVLMAMLFVAGARIKHLFIVSSLSIPLIIYQVIFYPYRLQRFLSFLNPEATAGSTGYQLIQSFMAVGSGGWFGKGLGNSELKLEYLPAAHTDFIFSIMCEEIGLVGVLAIISVFCWLLMRGIGLARASKNTFHSLLIFGLTLTITMQAFFNMAMAIGLLPTKGIPLPFFSYGGSSVIMTLVMMGIIANVASRKNNNDVRPGDDFTEYRTRNR